MPPAEGERGPASRLFDVEAEPPGTGRRGLERRDGRASRDRADRRAGRPAAPPDTPPRLAEPPRPAGQPAGSRSRRADSPRRPETVARILWAIPWIAFAITIVVLGGPAFAAAMLGLALICQLELFGMARASRPLTGVAMLVTTALAAAAYLGFEQRMLLIALCALPLMFLAAATRRSVEGVTASFTLTLLAIVWIGVPFAHAILLREIPVFGAGLVVDVLVATFIADTAAYAGGRMFGRHLLAPALSPRKTVEGFLFGIAGGTAAFWFAGLYQDWLSGTDALLMGLCVAIVAPLGDLFESVMKRDLGVKDSGNALGPHGGLLDRLDAVLFTIVTGYYLALAFGY